MKIERKTLALSIIESEVPGAVSACFSTFNVVDKDGDIVLASAFQPAQPVPLTWAHDWAQPVGKGVIRVDADRAVFDGAFFLETQAGLEAYKTVKAMGSLQEYSFGFSVIDSSYETRDGKPVRVIKQAKVYEVSPVLVGAGENTRTLAIKTASAESKAAIPFKATAKAPEGEAWSAPALKDFTDKQWGDLTDAEISKITACFAWTVADPPPFFGALKLPHHNVQGQVVWMGVANCAARMGQATIPAGDMAGVKSHIRQHYAQFGKDIPEALKGAANTAKAADFNTTRAAAQAESDLWDLRYELSSALRESIDSIVSDDMLDTPTKLAMIRTSVAQYGEALVNWASQTLALAATGIDIGFDGLESADHKGRSYAEQAETALAAVTSLHGRSKSLADLRSKEGRTLSTANRDKLASLLEALGSVATEISDLLAATEPPKAIDPAYLERRLRASSFMLATRN